jgi:acetylornithine/N-succinyldiaminopimelate aminotransferase
MSEANLLPIHKRMDVKFSHGEGSYLFDQNGKKYLDFGAGIAVNALGHCHPKLVAALQEQSQKLWHISNIYRGQELEDTAKKLIDATFADYAFFCNSGAEAIECGIKMVRKYFSEQNKTHKNRIITFKGAFHGRTMATISAACNPTYINGFEPALDGFDNVEFGNIEAVKNAINENTAGILIEPIQGEQGICVASKEFLQELRQLADKNDLLLFLDEVQCGVGRTGHFYAYEHYDITPDIIASAKGIGGGFPLGVCLATKKAASGMGTGSHGTTFGGNPLAMAVGGAVLDEILSAGFLANVQKNGAKMKEGLGQLQQKFPQIIDEVRGLGLMLGIKLNAEYLAAQMVPFFKDRGLLLVAAGNNVLRFLPPLNIDESEICEALKILENGFENQN